MSQNAVYQKMLSETIHSFILNKKLTTEQIMIEVFQSIMQAEREVFLNEANDNKGNGYYQRFIQSFQGKLLLHIPRDRQGVFHPLLLEILKQDTERMQALALMLYRQGVSHRGVSDVFQSIFKTSMSPARLSQLVKAFEPHRIAWQNRPLEQTYPVLIIDAIHHSVRRGTVAKEAVYLVMGLKQDMTREILGLYLVPQETAEGWESVFMDLKQRGLERVGMVLCDELSGVEAAIERTLPHRFIQCCLVHKIRRLLGKARHAHKRAMAEDWRTVLSLDDPLLTPEAFEARLIVFIEKWASVYPHLRRQLPEEKWRYYSAYCHYPVGIRRMLYTTNWIERFNKEVRKVTRHVNSFPTPDSALNLVFMVIKTIEESTYSKPITSFYPYRTFIEETITGQTQNS